MNASKGLTRDVPPETIAAGGLLLRRLVPDDAPAVAGAVLESIDHLAPWMPWATVESNSTESQRVRLLDPARTWSATSDYEFGIFLPGAEAGFDAMTLVGACGLHRRPGPDALEIGYWVHVDHVGRDIATRSARALTDAALRVRGIRSTEIHCDAANTASAAVAHRLGYVLVDERVRPPTAPAEQGLEQVWRFEP